MASLKRAAGFASCPHCGATTHMIGARFCGHCGASLTDAGSGLPEWQRSAPAKYSHVSMPRNALSCPECGEPMRFGFRKVCRRCGARLVMIPRLLHPTHYRGYVAGPRAALAEVAVELCWLMVVLGGMALIGHGAK